MLLRYFNAYVLFPYLEKKARRIIAPKLSELRSFEKLSIEDQEKVRRTQLHAALIFAQNNVPYYTELFKALGFQPEKVLQDIKYIEELPVLTKAVVRENEQRLRFHEAVHQRKTGGSTGQSVFFYYDTEGLDWASAINLRAYEMVGNLPHKKDSHISSEIGVGPITAKEKFLDWLKLFSQNRTRVMIRSFSEADLKKSFETLNSRRPYLLQGHPSSAYALAMYVERHGLRGPKYCQVFEPSGESLTPKVVSSVEANLGCKVTNRYGNAEFGVMAHSLESDPYTRLKIFNRAFYIEPGRDRNLIVSNFTNRSFPLFRYDTGDIGTVVNEEDGSYLYNLQGRIHDNVSIAGEVYATHYIMDYLDHKIRKVREFQILTSKDANPVLSIVPEEWGDSDRIRNEVNHRWPNGLQVQFVQLEDLKKVGWQNKFRHVIEVDQSS